MDYTNLKIGDLVNYSGTNAFSLLIRTVEAGLKNALDPKIATHTGIVCKMEDQFLVCGMRLKPALESLDDKEIISVMRHPAINDADRSEINKLVAYGVRKAYDYDWAGDIEFVLPFVKASDKKFYCSEYYKFLTSKYIIYTKPKYTPYDLQCMSGFTTVWSK
jgi:hypothetical protein